MTSWARKGFTVFLILTFTSNISLGYHTQETAPSLAAEMSFVEAIGTLTARQFSTNSRTQQEQVTKAMRQIIERYDAEAPLEGRQERLILALRTYGLLDSRSEQAAAQLADELKAWTTSLEQRYEGRELSPREEKALQKEFVKKFAGPLKQSFQSTGSQFDPCGIAIWSFFISFYAGILVTSYHLVKSALLSQHPWTYALKSFAYSSGIFVLSSLIIKKQKCLG